MQLFHSPTSPFVRKVLVTAHETGLAARIELLPANPWEQPPALTAINPLSKVPALLTDDGTILYDSPVICEYLDSLHGGARLVPESGAQRWQVLRVQALADGILDAAVLRRLELLRPTHLQSSEWLALQASTIGRGLDALEHEAVEWGGETDLGRITAACALGYLDFRFGDEQWRTTRENLHRWYATFRLRPSMTATAHPEG